MVSVWVIYAFVGFLGYFFVNFLFKFVAGENPFAVSFILYTAAAVTMLFVLAPRFEFGLSYKSLLISAMIGIFSVIATVYAIKSINLSPNPGDSAAISSANFVLVAIVSLFVFGSSITFVKMAGIFSVLIGLVLLSI
ncbi:MAG: hypothetical protein KAS12_02325 [Candidatus Aenigmarchaeota archaeon]|nr:hypothetical protein [Candidatus Aenigmarchaeota archaeon]